MPSRNQGRRAAAVATSLLLLPALSSPALAAAAPDADPPSGPCLVQVNEDGFGDPTNRYAWSMEVFQGRLYVGTYNTDGEGTLGGGAELWRSSDGSTWERTVDGGFDDVANSGIRNLVVHGGQLYAGTNNPTEGAEIWRSPDGATWERVASGGLGDDDQISVRGMESHGGRLYASTVNNFGAGELYSSLDGGSWERAADPGFGNPETRAASVLRSIGGDLYAGTWSATGGEIHRLDEEGTGSVALVGGDAATPAGFGDEDHWIMDLAGFHGALYASTENFDDGFGVFRSTDGGESWEAALTGGLNDNRNRYGWRMIEHAGRLWVGTWLVGHAFNARIGGQLYSLGPQGDWEQEAGPTGRLAGPGLGDTLNYGIRTLAEFQGDLYLGTAQCFFCSEPVTGAEIWRYRETGCPRDSAPDTGCVGDEATALAALPLALGLISTRRSLRWRRAPRRET